MNLLIVAATPFEITPLHQYLEANFTKESAIIYTKNGLHIHLLVTGIGLTHTAYALGRYMGSVNIDAAWNVGIAGAYDRTLALGQVVNVVEDQFGDLGIEHADGSFQDLFDAELIALNQSPFIHKKLINTKAINTSFLTKVKGTSVNTVHGSAASIEQFSKANPNIQIETMEGAAFMMVCLQEQVSFLQIRSISNYVEPRDRSKWEIALAIENLNETVVEMVNNYLEN